MKLTIGKKIMGGFLFVIVIMLFMSTYTYIKVGGINSDYQSMIKSDMNKLAMTEELAIDIAEEAATVRRFNITGDQAARNKFETLRSASGQKITQMKQLYTTAEAQKLIARVEQDKIAYEGFAEKAMQAQIDKNPTLVISYVQQGASHYENASAGADELVSMIKKFVGNEKAALADQVARMQQILLVLNLIALLAALAVSVMISRGISTVAQQLVAAATEIANGVITKKEVVAKSSDEMGQMAVAFNKMKENLRELLEKVAGSVEHVSASSEELTANANQSALASSQVAESVNNIALGTEQQMHATSTTTGVVEQMSASVQQAAVNANEVSSLSNKTAAAAQSGGATLEKAITQMTHIERAVGASAGVVGTLGERSKEIGQIVDTISGIAGQTNLLALNAAIEAARAGEQGKGFAVVAEEVRKLAEQSQEAAKEIADLIGAIQEDTQQAVTAMDEGTREVKLGTEAVNAAGSAFQEINGLILQVSSQIKEISAAMQQMAASSEQIVSSVEEIDDFSKKSVEATQSVSAATEEQSASMEEIAAASQSLAKMAEELQAAISKFNFA